MLENEPEGVERAGSEPVGDTAESTPTRRARTTRRRAIPPVEPGVPVEASTPVEPPLTEAAPVEVDAPLAGDVDTAPKSPRRRRKTAPVNKPDEQADSGQAAARGAEEPPRSLAEETGPAGKESGPAAEGGVNAEPATKTTRSRRKKAAPPQPVEPETTGFGAAAQGSPADAGSTEIAEPAAEASRSRRRRAALSAPTVLFMAPEPEELPPPRRGEAAPEAAEPGAEARPAEEVPTGDLADTSRRRRRGRRAEPVETAAGVDEDIVTAVDVDAGNLDAGNLDAGDLDARDVDEEEEDEDESAAMRRRRRRGRRGRGRGKGTADEFDEDTDELAPAEAERAEEEEDTEEGDGLTRRRRRRRRKGAGEIDVETEDGVHTVVRIREPRRVTDEVQGVSGSTRLEAKRQRRRDGREQRRTRPPILSESEFLARREAVDRVMVVRQRGDRTQIGVLEDGVLVEHYVSRHNSGTMVGNVYLGKVQNVLPSMEAAFVDVGRGRNAVLYAGEVNWDSTGLEGRARSIEQALHSGDSVLVQVTKDPIGHKGARLTSHIALSGRHLVYVPHGNASGISRKLPDTERKRLRDILKKLVPDGAGVIVRTAAEGASEEELARDVKRLQAQWEDIQAKAAEGGAPVLLYEEPDLVVRVVRDLFNEDFRDLVVQGDEAYDTIESYLTHVSPDLVARLRRHVGVTDVFAEKRIDEQILKGLDRKVFLPSGGSLVIDRTEAMTVVDVNTGKYTGTGGNLEETVTRNNLEAAEEIVRQLRLRDLGGIVVIDFIDMVLESNRELVLRRLTECLGRDRTKHQVTEITSLGLVQMTRKRIGAGLLEAFSETCECCKGRGVIIHTEPVAEKPRATGAGEKVKAVASASAGAAPATAEAPPGGRRRGRKSARPEPVAVEAEVVDEDETMGYDLSRYEVETPTATGEGEDRDAESSRLAGSESSRLAGSDDPDAAYDTVGPEDEGEDSVESATGGRRRSRRGGTRRRTRP